jgi:chaperonin GroES
MASKTALAAIDDDSLDVEVPTQLPTPTGFRIILAPLTVAEKTAGGIILPDQRRDDESAASVIACVLAMGDDCYADEKRFPHGAWCKVGDWVLVPSYTGMHLKVQGMDLRVVNDDTIQAVVVDPRGISRA